MPYKVEMTIMTILVGMTKIKSSMMILMLAIIRVTIVHTAVMNYLMNHLVQHEKEEAEKISEPGR